MWNVLSGSLIEQAERNIPSALVLTAFVTAIAYVRSPRAKALIYSMPVPFSCAYVATRLPINATHLTGLMLVVGYNWLVYVLREKARAPLLLAIGLSAVGYFGAAMALRPLAGMSMAWIAGVAAVGWLINVLLYHARAEPMHRSRTAWYVKAPLIFAIGMGIYNATGLLAGGVGMFPYAGVFTSYEMRHSLRTLAGQFTINALGLLLCLLMIAGAERRYSAPVPLLLGWVAVLAWAGVVQGLRLGRHATTPPSSGAASSEVPADLA